MDFSRRSERTYGVWRPGRIAARRRPWQRRRRSALASDGTAGVCCPCQSRWFRLSWLIGSDNERRGSMRELSGRRVGLCSPLSPASQSHPATGALDGVPGEVGRAARSTPRRPSPGSHPPSRPGRRPARRQGHVRLDVAHDDRALSPCRARTRGESNLRMSALLSGDAPPSRT